MKEKFCVTHQTLTRNTQATMIANFFYLLSRLILAPYYLTYLSLDEYGIWAYSSLLASYLTMTIYGVTNVYIRYNTVHAAQGEVESVGRLMSTGMILVFLFFMCLFPLIWFFLPYFFPLFHIPQELYFQAKWVIFGTLITSLFELVFGAFSSLLQSLQLFAWERGIWALSYLVDAFLSLFLLHIGMGLYGLLTAFLFHTVIVCVGWGVLSYQSMPGLKLGWKKFDKDSLQKFLRFGGVVQISGLLTTLTHSIEKILAGLFLGPASVAFYDLGGKWPWLASNLPNALNQVLLPTAAHFHHQHEKVKIKSLYLTGGRIAHTVMGAMMGFSAAFASPIVTCWFGVEQPTVTTILQAYALFYQVDLLIGPISAIFRGIHQPQRDLLFPLMQLSLILVTATISILLFGASIQVINNTIVSMTLLSALIFVVWSNGYMRISQMTYLQYVVLPGLLPYGVAYILYSLWPVDSDLARPLTLALAFGLYAVILGAFHLLSMLTKSDGESSVSLTTRKVT